MTKFLRQHWDGKMLSDLTSKEKRLEITDRLAIVLSANGKTKLLRVPKILNGTGRIQADAVFNALADWNVLDKIKAMCFDTTASNTGIRNGTCVLLEKLQDRTLLNLPCRHHMHELIIAKAYSVVMSENSAGPDTQIFKRFQNFWPKLNKDNFKSADETTISNIVHPKEKEDMLKFIDGQLELLQNFQTKNQ